MRAAAHVCLPFLQRLAVLQPHAHMARELIRIGIIGVDLVAHFAGEAIAVMPMTPEEFGKFIQADIARWSALARERNIRLDD